MVAFPAGTGIAHTFINNGDTRARLLIFGEKHPDEQIARSIQRRGSDNTTCTMRRRVRWDQMTEGPIDEMTDKSEQYAVRHFCAARRAGLSVNCLMICSSP